MKNLLAAALCLLVFTISETTIAAPESPFHVTVMLGETTLDIQSHNYDARQVIENGEAPIPATSIQVDYEAQDSQRISMMISGGYSIFDWLAVEAQLASSLGADELYSEVRRSTDTTNNNPDAVYSTMDVTSSAAGIYAVFQTSGEAYAKARFGMANSTAKFETDHASKSFSSTHLSYGASIGQQFGFGALELTYMRYPDVEVSRREFEDTFLSVSSLGEETGVTVRRRLTYEILAIGYVFRF